MGKYLFPVAGVTTVVVVVKVERRFPVLVVVDMVAVPDEGRWRDEWEGR